MLVLLIILRGSEISVSSKQRSLFNWLGQVSYPLYLCHLAVVLSTFCIFEGQQLFGLVWLVVYPVALTEAILLNHLVDLPIQRLRLRGRGRGGVMSKIGPVNDNAR
jgi:peptidoglycan/LPS O-acetylase OafA/YrhL